MRINNNIMALNTHRQYGIANAGLANSAEKLSSGYKVNRAGDDAAGLAISEKMRAQIRGLNMASKNSQDAVSLVQTAEGALTETHSMLQRMRELAVQSGSDTNEGTVDRKALDAEFQQLVSEIDETARITKFNDRALIDGSYAGATKKATIDGTNGLKAGASIVGLEDVFDVDSTKLTIAITDTEITITGKVDNTSTSFKFNWDDINGSSVTDKSGRITINFSDTIDKTTGTTANARKDEIAGKLEKNAGATDIKIEADAAKDPLVIQTGANQGDTLSISINAMNATAIGVAGKDISTRKSASEAITFVNRAINVVSTQRANLGATQNRLQHKVNNLDTSAENLQAAESRIRDVDMAKEMSTYTKQNILIQASTSMLAQANQSPQNVLSLLR